MWRLSAFPFKLRKISSFLIKIMVLCVIVISLTVMYKAKEIKVLLKDHQRSDKIDHILVKRDKREPVYKDDLLNLWSEFKKEIREELVKNKPVATVQRTFYYQNINESLPKENESTQTADKIKQPEIKRITPTSNTTISKLLEEPILNPFEISYHINDPKSHCSQNKTLLLIVVPSAPGNFQRREKVRKYDQATHVKNQEHRAKLLFFLGSLDKTGKESKSIQDRIDKEQALHGDIVQATFLDNYKNITMKAASLLHWGSTYCREAKFLLRTDDDVKVNTSKIVASIERQSLTHEQFILGKTRKNEYPYPDPKGQFKKYFVPNSQWSHKKPFPTFLLGGTYALPMKTAGLLLETMRRTKFLWLDDVFVTGVCAQRVGVPIFSDKAFEFGHKNK